MAAVHGFCLGGGVGLAGNVHVIVASDEALLRLRRSGSGRAGRPPISRAPVPAHKMRSMVYTSSRPHGRRLHALRSVWAVVPPSGTLDESAPNVSRHGAIALESHRLVIGLQGVLKHRLWDVKRSLSLRAGTYLRAPLSWVADEPRDAFVGQRSPRGINASEVQAEDDVVPARRLHDPRAVAVWW